MFEKAKLHMHEINVYSHIKPITITIYFNRRFSLIILNLINFNVLYSSFCSVMPSWHMIFWRRRAVSNQLCQTVPCTWWLASILIIFQNTITSWNSFRIWLRSKVFSVCPVNVLTIRITFELCWLYRRIWFGRHAHASQRFVTNTIRYHSMTILLKILKKICVIWRCEQKNLQLIYTRWI